VAGKVRIEFDAQAQRAVQEFDKLTKKQQQLIIQGSKVGKSFDNAEKKVRRLGRSGNKAFDGMKSRMVAAIDPMSILAKAAQVLNGELEKNIRLNKKAAQAQITFSQARQSFIANNQSELRQNKTLLRDVESFAKIQGKGLGRGGAAEVISAFTDVRSKVGKDSTLQQQKEALTIAAERKRRLDPTTDLAQTATANIRVQQQLGISGRKAQNIISTFGEFAGGDINQFIPEFGALSGVATGLRETQKAETGKARTKLTDILALEGVLSQRAGFSPEETTTLLSNALGRVGSAKFKGKQLKFQSDEAVDQFLELLTRAGSGEFGTSRTKVLTSAGIKGGKALATLGNVIKDLPGIQAARDQIGGGAGGVDLQTASIGLVSKQARIQQRVRTQLGAQDISEIENVEAAKRAASIDILRSEREQQRVGFLGDPSTIVREGLISAGLIGEEEGRILQESQGQVSVGDLKITSPIVSLVTSIGELITFMNEDRLERKDKELRVPPGPGQEEE